MAELRPKGRGRPQRILTGSWPEDHVHGVIRAVVFRDPTSLPRHFDREDAIKLTASAPASAASAAAANRLVGHGRLLAPPPQPAGVANGSGVRGLVPNSIGHHGTTDPQFNIKIGKKVHSDSIDAMASLVPKVGALVTIVEVFLIIFIWDQENSFSKAGPTHFH